MPTPVHGDEGGVHVHVRVQVPVFRFGTLAPARSVCLKSPRRVGDLSWCDCRCSHELRVRELPSSRSLSVGERQLWRALVELVSVDPHPVRVAPVLGTEPSIFSLGD